MKRIAENFKVKVLFNNGVTKVYEIPFKENVEITEENYERIVKNISDTFNKSYQENLGASFYGEDIDGKNFIINILQTSSVEFYL